jgi:hypothetical protein
MAKVISKTQAKPNPPIKVVRRVAAVKSSNAPTTNLTPKLSDKTRSIPFIVSRSNTLIVGPLLIAIVFSLSYFYYKLSNYTAAQCTVPITKSVKNNPAQSAADSLLPVTFSNQTNAEPLNITPATDQSITVNPEANNGHTNNIDRHPAANTSGTYLQASNDGAASFKQFQSSKAVPHVENRSHNVELYKL